MVGNYKSYQRTNGIIPITSFLTRTKRQRRKILIIVQVVIIMEQWTFFSSMLLLASYVFFVWSGSCSMWISYAFFCFLAFVYSPCWNNDLEITLKSYLFFFLFCDNNYDHYCFPSSLKLCFFKYLIKSKREEEEEARWRTS